MVPVYSEMPPTWPVFMTFLSPARLMLEVARGPITEQRAGVAVEVSSGFCDPNRFTDEPIQPNLHEKED